MRSIELFTGAGGLALGIHRAGFDHLAVIERDRDSCDTLRLNRRRGLIAWPIEQRDVATIEYAQLPTGIELLAAGAPCQPFSLGGKHAGEADARNMFPEVIRAVRELRPRAFLLENVKGLTRETFLPYFQYIIGQLGRPHLEPLAGEGWADHAARLCTDRDGQAVCADRYEVAFRLCNVADYGVPQVRHRVFIVGFRGDLGLAWNFPAPTHSEEALLYAQYVDNSYWAEHDLSPGPIPPRLSGRIAQLAAKPKPLARRWRTVRNAIHDLPEPVDYTRHSTIDNHAGIPDARSYKGHTGSPWDWPAKAIKAGDHGNPGGENMLRRDDGSVRYFTVRELARLQTFPDTWHFANSWTESRRQLGNAVPVLMAELLAREIRAALEQQPQRIGRQQPAAASV
jgi:DNA (cytosine-5)-methyltransferase 1